MSHKTVNRKKVFAYLGTILIIIVVIYIFILTRLNEYVFVENIENNIVNINSEDIISKSKELTYPRSNLFVNVTELPDSLQIGVFCGHGQNCEPEAVCHCPVKKNKSYNNTELYPKIDFDVDSWETIYGIKPPIWNEILIANSSIDRISHSYTLYQQRSKDNFCKTGAGQWAQWSKPGYHKCFARVVGERLNFVPGDKVLDMGCGCGHKLTLWSHWFGIHGMGFDYTLRNVENTNMLANINNLSFKAYHASIQSIYLDNWIPNESFNYIYSNAVLMYLDFESACLVIEKAIQILKINGVAWFGWNRAVIDKLKKLKKCIASFKNINVPNDINITFEWLEHEEEFLGRCHKSPPAASFLIQRWK